MLSALIALSIVIIAILYPFIPSTLQPTVWKNPSMLVKPEGVFSKNDLLGKEKVKKIKGDFSGPESIAFDPYTGIAYASFDDGTVGAFTSDGQFIEHVFFVGGFVQSLRNPRDREHLYQFCREESKAKRLAWNKDHERLCGRPLGLRYNIEKDGSYLYILDAYHGLFVLNLQNNETSHLISSDTTAVDIPLHLYDSKDDEERQRLILQKAAIVKQPIVFYNDFDILENGDIIFSDSSYLYTRSENRQELLDGSPRGRIHYYIRKTFQRKVLFCGFHFPNGVQLLKSQHHQNSDKVQHDVTSTSRLYKKKKSTKEVIISDSGRFRLFKLNLNALFVQGTGDIYDEESRSTINHLDTCLVDRTTESVLDRLLAMNHYEKTGVSLFSPNIPGFVDNIRYDDARFIKASDPLLEGSGNDNYYLIALGTPSFHPFSLLWYLYQSYWIRDLIGKVVPMWLVEYFVPPYGLVLVANQMGTIISSLHDPTGQGSNFISQASRHPTTGDLWLGTHSLDQIVIVPYENLPRYW